MIKKKRLILLSFLLVALSSAWSLFTTEKVSAQEESEVEETSVTTIEESTVEEPVETTVEEVTEEEVIEESDSHAHQEQYVTINPVYENDRVVSGTASMNTTIAVLYIGKGQMITAGVDAEGNWSVEIPKDFKLKAGEVFQATSISRKLQVVVAEVEVQEAN